MTVIHMLRYRYFNAIIHLKYNYNLCKRYPIKSKIYVSLRKRMITVNLWCAYVIDLFFVNLSPFLLVEYQLLNSKISRQYTTNYSGSEMELIGQNHGHQFCNLTNLKLGICCALNFDGEQQISLLRLLGQCFPQVSTQIRQCLFVFEKSANFRPKSWDWTWI